MGSMRGTLVSRVIRPSEIFPPQNDCPLSSRPIKCRISFLYRKIIGVSMSKSRCNILAPLMVVGCLLSAPASASDFSFTGNLAGDDSVQTFDFSVGASSNVTLRTWSYAGGTNAAGQVIARGGFDPILALFALPGGALIGQNDDGPPGTVAAEAVTGASFDTFLQEMLAPGNYRVSVMQFSNFAIGPNFSDGFLGSGTSNSQDFTGDFRASRSAFEILNVNASVQN